MVEPKKHLKEAVGYEPTLEEKYVMKLDFNENLIGPSPKVIEAIKKITADKINFYPAYQTLSNTLAEHNGVTADMILPTNGADEALCYIINTFVESDENIITASPYFLMNKIYARIPNATIKEIEYETKWEYPIDNVVDAIDEKTKLIIITTPNSPTGESISSENIERIITNAQNALVMIDETYGTYANKSYAHLARRYSNVAVIKSMSKDFAIAGLRLGYIISDKQNVNYIRSIASPCNVNTIATVAAIAAISDIKHIDMVKKEIQKSKEYLIKELSEIATVFPSETNFLLIDFGQKATAIYERLLMNGIKTKMFTDGILKNHFRLTIPPINQAKKLVEIIKVKNLIVFDMDGVLIDVGESYRLAVKKTFEYLSGKELPLEKIQEAKNLGGLNNDWDLTEYLLKQSNVEMDKRIIVDKFQEFYFGEKGEGLIQNEQLLICKNILKSLAKNHQLSVFTGRPKKEALFSLEHFGIKNLFSEIITMDDLDEDMQKPNPYGLFMIMSKLKPKNTFYLGDTIDDMQAAMGAKIHGIGVLPPQDKSKNLKKLLKSKGAMVVLNSVNDIIKFRELK
ncbi:MAG: aminotransferase class I/II-fold pyridoxal phosphate-dependent enzyme [Candidatus Gastranaerophilales bacterium]|nr:aminotransferase class I/II-fold pyridoxal phosphate-dependent enzyme [Candidatus Gastranaerophilales bacterium]